MIANIISRYDLTLLDTVTVSEYEISETGDFDGKSQIVLHRKPQASESDFVVLHDKGVIFQGIISSIEKEKGKAAYTVNAIELQKLFDRKVIIANDNLLATGIEDFIANQIVTNFVTSDDKLLNISYLNVIAKTHTPTAAKPETEEGIYNLCTYMGNALTNQGIFTLFEFNGGKLNVTIEKKAQSLLQIDTSLANITNLTEIFETKALAKLTVLWTSGTTKVTKQFFLKSDRTITDDINDPDRAKGDVDVMLSIADTEEAMRQEALDKFKANSYQHKITFDVVPSRMIDKSELYVGHQLLVKTSNGVKESIITGIGHSNGQAAVNVTLGQLAVTLIEKLKGVETKR